MHHHPANSDMGFKSGRAVCNRRVPMGQLAPRHSITCQECRTELERRIANDEAVIAGIKAGAPGFVSGDAALDARMLAAAMETAHAMRLALVEF
jgi:hypothetical protein